MSRLVILFLKVLCISSLFLNQGLADSNTCPDILNSHLEPLDESFILDALYTSPEAVYDSQNIKHHALKIPGLIYNSLDELPQSQQDGNKSLAISVPEGSTLFLSTEDASSIDFITSVDFHSCVGVVIRDIKSGALLVSHFLTLKYSKAGSIEAYTQQLKTQFSLVGGNISNSAITIMWGPSGRFNFESRVENLVKALIKEKPERVLIDSSSNVGKGSTWGLYVDTQRPVEYKNTSTEDLSRNFDY